MEEMIQNYRICVDGQYYTGEKECSLNTWTSYPWSGNAFQTKRVDRNVLTFEPKENNNFKVVTGITNLIGEMKKIIQFISMTGLMAGEEITIEAEPFKVPLELNLDYFLGLESDLSRQKQICANMKSQLDIATDLGQNRFAETETLRAQLADAQAENDGFLSMMKSEVFDGLSTEQLIFIIHSMQDERGEKCLEYETVIEKLKDQLEEAGKALSGLGYTPSADDSGSYDSLVPDEYL